MYRPSITFRCFDEWTGFAVVRSGVFGVIRRLGDWAIGRLGDSAIQRFSDSAIRQFASSQTCLQFLEMRRNVRNREFGDLNLECVEELTSKLAITGLHASAGFVYTGFIMGWKKIVIVFIALWLPLQGYGAVAMPFCDHGPSMPDSSAAVFAHSDAHDGSQGHVAKPAHDHANHDHATSHDSSRPDKSSQKHAGLGCNDCGPCQLACAPLIFSTAPHLSSAGSPVYDPLPIASLISFSPEQLQRPPVPAFV